MFVQQHSLKKSTQFAQSAFERIMQEGLVPHPENFELWYIYYSKESAEITRAIDILEAKKQKFTNEKCHELHQKFLGEQDEAAHVREAGDKIQEAIKDVTGIVDSSKLIASRYSKSLSTVSEKLDGNISGNTDEIRLALQNVKVETDSVIAHNVTLEQKLAQSVQAMEELQSDLDAVRKEAMTDGLTGLANRKAFDEEIDRLIRRIEAGEYKTFSLLLMDIDFFKKFNDTFGHLVGDQVLKLVGKTMVDSVKGRDMVSRFGGEEFAVLLPDTNAEFGLRVGDNLRHAIVDKEIINRSTGERIARITLSGGVAEYIAGESVENLIERADKALYHSKNAGRNKVMIAD